MKSPSLIHTSWLKPFADYFAKRRLSLRTYYDRAKVEPEQVASGDSWITKQQLYGFLTAVARGERMPELGFVVGETMTPDSLGALGDAMAEAETLGDAIRIFCQLINRSTEENRAWLEEGDQGEVWLLDQTTNPFPADRRIADHAGLMSLINLVRLVEGPAWYPEKAALQTGATSAFRKVEGLRDTEMAFDQPATGLAFSAGWLLRPIRLERTSSGSGFDQSGLLSSDESAAEKLTRLLREILGVGGMAPTIQLMAELCGTSPRTLHRRLGDEAVSYRKLLDRVRIDRAKEQLKGPGISVKQLAFDLGYSGPNNFIRAFKRIEGVTPTEFRQRRITAASVPASPDR